MRPEIQAYFRSVAEKYRVIEHVRFHSIVEKAEWDDVAKVWIVTIQDLKTKQKIVRRAKVLISGVGSLSVPKTCDLPGVDEFKGKMFHSAQWDHSFDWKNKDVVVLGKAPKNSSFHCQLKSLHLQETAAQQHNSFPSWPTTLTLSAKLPSSPGKHSISQSVRILSIVRHSKL
jgi:lysine/ornithine N-monooxygenase